MLFEQRPFCPAGSGVFCRSCRGVLEKQRSGLPCVVPASASAFFRRVRQVVKGLSWRAAAGCELCAPRGAKRFSWCSAAVWSDEPHFARSSFLCSSDRLLSGADAPRHFISLAAQGIRRARSRNPRRVMRLFVYNGMKQRGEETCPPERRGHGAPKQSFGESADSLPRERECPLAHST